MTANADNTTNVVPLRPPIKLPKASDPLLKVRQSTELILVLALYDALNCGTKRQQEIIAHAQRMVFTAFARDPDNDATHDAVVLLDKVLGGVG